jgi:hypothetical protein
VRRAARAGGRVALALLGTAAFSAFWAGGAFSDARFGDSAWVAPASPDAGDSAFAGPRVAPRDHERGWESALRAPFRVAFYPLHLLANGLEGGIGILGPRYLDPKPPRPPKLGPILTPAISLGALNDIGVGPALTWPVGPTAHAKLRVAGTWSAIDHRRAHASWTTGERRPVGLRLRAGYDDKPNRRFYGIGNASVAAGLAYFRLASTEAEVAVLLGSSPLRQVAIEGGYSAMSTRRGSHASPLLEDVWKSAGAALAPQSSRDLWFGVAGDYAALDDVRNPSSGAHGQFDVRRLVGVRTSDPGYDQWCLEGRAYLPVFAKRRVIAMRAVYAGVGPGRVAGIDVPFYGLPQSEDASRFAGFSAGRFRDRQLVHARIEYRWEVFHGASALALYDAGEVQPRTGLFRLGDAHVSYGGGVRMGLSDVATIRAELAHSVEGLHAVLILGGDF